MNLENTIRKVSLGLAGLSLAANISCTSGQQDKLVGHEPTEPSAPAAEHLGGLGGNVVLRAEIPTTQQLDLSKARVLPLHYHKQFSEQDLYHYFRAEYPATKQVSFNKYKRRVFQLNNALNGNMVDLLKLPDLNGNRKVGSRNYFP